MNNGQDWTAETERQAEAAIGYAFSDKELLRTAFTHKSYANVHACEHNDRLEFLGDAVLQICVSERLFPDKSLQSGSLTALRQEYVSEVPLTAAENRADLMRFLRYSGGKDNLEGKTNSNLFEAVTAAIYLDGGKEAAAGFIWKFLQRVEMPNYKSLLQEYVQSKTKSTPAYRKWEEDGVKYSEASALGRKTLGRGNNYAEAEKEAARALLVILREEV